MIAAPKMSTLIAVGRAQTVRNWCTISHNSVVHLHNKYYQYCANLAPHFASAKRKPETVAGSLASGAMMG